MTTSHIKMRVERALCESPTLSSSCDWLSRMSILIQTKSNQICVQWISHCHRSLYNSFIYSIPQNYISYVCKTHCHLQCIAEYDCGQNIGHYTTFEAPTPENNSTRLFWNMMPFILVIKYQHFGGTNYF
jgi:hypothetical protein